MRVYDFPPEVSDGDLTFVPGKYGERVIRKKFPTEMGPTCTQVCEVCTWMRNRSIGRGIYITLGIRMNAFYVKRKKSKQIARKQQQSLEKQLNVDKKQGRSTRRYKARTKHKAITARLIAVRTLV